MQRQGEIIEATIQSLLVKCWVESVWDRLGRAASRAEFYMENI